MWKKLKSFLANDTYFIVILVVLIGIGSFGLGRLSIIEGQASVSVGVGLQQLSSFNVQKQAQNNKKQPVVASKSGSKYHLLDCPGALQMKEENKIEFASREEAEAAGYSPAANCPGL